MRAARLGAFVLLLAAPAAAERTICVVDEAALLARSRLASSMAARFQQVRSQAQGQFERDMAALAADERANQSVRGQLRPEVFEARTSELARRRAALQARGERINRDLASLDTDLTANALRLAVPAIHAAAVSRGCVLTVPRRSLLDLADPSLDITADVIGRLATVPQPSPGR